MDYLQPQAAETTPEGTASLPTSAETAPVSAPADGDGSLSAHEAAHGATAPETDEADEARNERGQFVKPKRRAASQQAAADDVPAIHAQTARLKALEETHGKDIARKDGESERVFQLRRRADLLERLNQVAAAPAAQALPSDPRAPQLQTQTPQFQPQVFPEYEEVLQQPGYENLTFNQYLAAQAQFVYRQQREAEKQQEAAEKAASDYQSALTTHQQNLKTEMDATPDWATVVTPDLPWTRVLDEAVVSATHGAKALYYLGQHRDVLASLVAKSLDYSPAAVSTMRQLLDSFVAMQRPSSSSSLPAAGSTGAALKLAPPPAPKPPTPVRTGTVTDVDEPPGDESQSLSAHEKHFGRRHRA